MINEGFLFNIPSRSTTKIAALLLANFMSILKITLCHKIYDLLVTEIAISNEDGIPAPKSESEVGFVLLRHHFVLLRHHCVLSRCPFVLSRHHFELFMFSCIMQSLKKWYDCIYIETFSNSKNSFFVWYRTLKLKPFTSCLVPIGEVVTMDRPVVLK